MQQKNILDKLDKQDKILVNTYWASVTSKQMAAIIIATLCWINSLVGLLNFNLLTSFFYGICGFIFTLCALVVEYTAKKRIIKEFFDIKIEVKK